MRSIRIDNPLLNSYITDIGEDYSPTQSSPLNLTTRNNNSFSINDLIVAGGPAEEQTEQKKITGLSGNLILTLASALKFSHNKGTPIYKSIWDFVSIEGRSSSLGVFAELTQSPIQWDSKTNQTIYFHSDGTDTWEYRFRFYNSVTLTYSEYSSTLTGLGFEENQMGYIIREARKIAGDKDGRVLTTDELLRSASRAKNIIRAHNQKYWFWKVNGFQDGVYITALASTSVYSLASVTDFGVIDTIEFRITQGGLDEKYALDPKGDAEFLSRTRNLNRAASNFPSKMRLLPANANSVNGYIELDRKILTDSVGKIYINYWKKEANYSGVADTTAIALPEILQDYLTAEIYAAKGNSDMAKKYYDLFAGPEGRQKTLPIEKLSGIALLDELDKQNKKPQGHPSQLWNFKGQRGVKRMYGSRGFYSGDYDRENYFRDER